MATDRIRAIIAEHLGIDEDEVTNDKFLSEDLDADSLDTLEIVLALEAEFHIDIPEEEAMNATRVLDLAALVEARLPWKP